MNRLMRCAATTTASAVLAVGVLLGAGGVANAASLRTGGHVPARAEWTANVKDGNFGREGGHPGDGLRGYRFGDSNYRYGEDRQCGIGYRYRGTDTRFYPWVSDQLAIYVHHCYGDDMCWVYDWPHNSN